MWCDGALVMWCGLFLAYHHDSKNKSENRRCCRCYRPMFNWYLCIVLMLSNWVLKHLHIFASGVCFRHFHLANKLIYVREPNKFYNKPLSFTLSLRIVLLDYSYRATERERESCSTKKYTCLWHAFRSALVCLAHKLLQERFMENEAGSSFQLNGSVDRNM